MTTGIDVEVHECPYIGARPRGLVQSHWSIERAYFDLVKKVFALAEQEQVDRAEIMEVLNFPAYHKPNPPACDCGHEFSQDPKWWHLASCQYRAFYEE